MSQAHSATVKLTLRLGDRLLDVAQVARDFLILREPATSTATEGTLLMSIDGRVTETPIILPRGLEAQAGRIAYF